MDDAFERLGVGRGLVLEEGAVRAAFDRASGEVHPDAGGDREAFARVREAYDILRSPGRRLRHWLESGGVRWEAGGSVPEGLMQLFGSVGGLIQEVDRWAGRMAAAQSTLGRSMLEREAMGLAEDLEARMDAVRAMREDVLAGFGAFEEAGVQGCGEAAVEAARTLMFLEKWEGQLRERWAGLAV